MSKKLSPIWEYFEELTSDETKVLCKVVGCKAKVSRGKTGSTKANLSNAPMMQHLKLKHPKENSEFLKKKEEKKVVAEKRKADDEDSDLESGGAPIWNLRTSGKRQEFLYQAKVSDWCSAGSSRQESTYDIHDLRAKERHKGILMMVILDLQPWNMVNDPGFLYYSNTLDPHYKVASDKFYRSLLSKCYEKGVKKIENKIEKDEPESVCCQLDGWSAYRHGYIGLLVNYITPGWKRVSLCLACGPYDGHHTGENLGGWLEDKLEKWKVLDKTTVTVSDTAANMIKMMDFLPDHITHNPCLNHVLQLAINDEVLEKAEIKNLILNVRAFTNYAAISTLLSAALRSKEEVLGWKDSDHRALVQDVKTRWNSTLDMLERFLYLQEPVKKVLEDEEWKEKITVKTGGSAGRHIKFSGNDWKLMEKVVKVLGPFKEATLKLSAASSCISQSIPIITSILHTLKPSNVITDFGVKDLKRRLRENLNRRLDFLERSEIHSLATLLDPRYKNCFFTSSQAKEEAERRLVDYLKVEVLSGPLSRQNSLEEVDDPGLCDGLEAAFKAIQQNAKRASDTIEKETAEDVVKAFLSAKLEASCLSWWQKFETESKDKKIQMALCRIAKKYLTPPPTSTNCERLFSVAGQVMDEKRARMLPENLEKILFLRENLLASNYSLEW